MSNRKEWQFLCVWLETGAFGTEINGELVFSELQEPIPICRPSVKS